MKASAGFFIFISILTRYTWKDFFQGIRMQTIFQSFWSVAAAAALAELRALALALKEVYPGVSVTVGETAEPGALLKVEDLGLGSVLMHVRCAVEVSGGAGPAFELRYQPAALRPVEGKAVVGALWTEAWTVPLPEQLADGSFDEDVARALVLQKQDGSWQECRDLALEQLQAWSKLTPLQRELIRRANQGHRPVSVAEMDRTLRALGYKLARDRDCRSVTRCMQGLGAGESYPAVNTGVDEVDSGLSFSHVDARRDGNFKALQEIRFNQSLFALTGNAILDI